MIVVNGIAYAPELIALVRPVKPGEMRDGRTYTHLVLLKKALVIEYGLAEPDEETGTLRMSAWKKWTTLEASPDLRVLLREKPSGLEAAGFRCRNSTPECGRAPTARGICDYCRGREAGKSEPRINDDVPF